MNAAASEAAAAAIVSSGIPNATATVTGGVRLPGVIAGELGGTYDHPAVVGWANKADLVGGLIPSSQIPPVALVLPTVVTATADRVALTAQAGDVAIQTANPGRGTYMLKSGGNPATDTDWLLMVAPTDAVTSVQGYNGAVVLAKADLSLGSVDNTADTAKPVSTAQQTALNLKANNATTISAGTGLTGGGDLSANRSLAVSYGTIAGTAVQGNDSRVTGAVQTTRQVIAGTGLSGGGDLSADRTLAVTYGTAASTAAQGNDSRITAAVANTRQISSGTGLTGGGDLSADRTLTVAYGTTAGTATQGNDTRVVNAVQTTRQVVSGTGLTGGGDLTADRTLAVAYGTTSTTAAVGNDSRITAAVPNTRQVLAGTGLTGGGALSTDQTLTVAYGTSGTTACVGNDSRLSDARTPLAHTQASTTITNLPWASEMVCNSSALATGYNNMIGGALVEPGPNGTGINLDAIAVRLGDAAATIGGSGNLSIAIYLGSPTAAQTTLLTTITIAAGGHDTVATLGTPQACAANAVLRAYFTIGTTTVAGPVHIQFRGRYA